MEVICLEDAAFYKLIDEVVERVKGNMEQPFKWITPEKAMEMLNVSSKTTMQKYRDEGKIRYSQSDRKTILYDKDSINAFLEKNAQNTF